MDMQQEKLQFLGLFGIFKESIKIILTWPKIFIKITLAFILPLSIIFLANIGISKVFSTKMLHNMPTLDTTQMGSPTYNNSFSNVISSEWKIYWLFKAVDLIFSLILSLFSISAITYTIACIYTGKQIAFKKIMSVVPKVWKRLIITFLCAFGVTFAYTMCIAFLGIIVAIFYMFSTSSSIRHIEIATLVIILVLFMVGFVYISIIWQLANIVSVMETKCGIQAMIKSKALIKGKMGTTIAISLVLTICFLPIQVLIQQLVVNDGIVGIGGKICYGILSLGLMTLFSLLSRVVQTVLYFVCKSYHHEHVDKSLLADHLEVYHGEYAPLKVKDMQLEQFDV